MPKVSSSVEIPVHPRPFASTIHINTRTNPIQYPIVTAQRNKGVTKAETTI